MLSDRGEPFWWGVRAKAEPDLSMAKVLITGGAGFIGSHLATRMVELGHTVRVLDNLCAGHRRNLSHVLEGLELIEGDIRNFDTCQQACRGIDFVFHLAALGSVPKSVEQPQESHDTNINGTFNVLRAAVENRVRRLIYAGSSAVYGDTPTSPKHEGIKPEPLSPYAVQKLMGEHYCQVFCLCYGLETITLRYFNVFGTRQDPNSQYAAAIPAFVTTMLHGDRPTIFGDGEQSRDFTYVDDVVEGNRLAMVADKTSGQAVNIACGGEITVNHVIATLNRALRIDIQPHYTAPRAGDVRHSCADIGLARRLLNFQPSVPFEEGLSRAIDYYRTIA